jgi:hypothetical protein
MLVLEEINGVQSRMLFVQVYLYYYAGVSSPMLTYADVS